MPPKSRTRPTRTPEDLERFGWKPGDIEIIPPEPTGATPDSPTPQPGALSAAAAEPVPSRWRGLLLPLDMFSDDGRMFTTPDGDPPTRPAPFPLLFQDATDDGHRGSIRAGLVERVWLGDGGVWGEGTFNLDDPRVPQIALGVAKGHNRGVSADLAAQSEARCLDDNNEPVECDDDEPVNLDRMVFISDDWKMLAVTLVAIPAFQEAVIEALDANGEPFELPTTSVDNTGANTATTAAHHVDEPCEPCARQALAAAADVHVPLAPPAAWFDNPALPEPTPLTILDDGRIYGHLAQWGACHTGFAGRCVTPPRGCSYEQWFHLGSLVTAEGATIGVGKITMGGGHADLKAGARAAAAHYDNTCTQAAVVRAGEDQHGVWVAGALVPGITPEKIAELRRSPLSGDWREIRGTLQLIAALAVNAPGFPIPHPRVSLASSDHVTTLIATGVLAPRRAITASGDSDEPDRRQHATDRMRRSRAAQRIDHARTTTDPRT
ncbi:hypothetical protein ACQEVF_57060 [Nonomuraea polychroma]|uniref:hypothetical protein n=1 Tax=Nonomuraea polychroma TaxID=46176 RepID=UPI003D8E1B8A